ncbi:MAG TPA: hypothetical protein VE196_08385 [Pseudonocardiaceae bacterium]|jgi:hypothetical protein|nr:hypothetical protein [Pseudonocardiaceae bacterium]
MSGYLNRVRQAKENLRQADQDMQAWTGNEFPEDLNDTVGQRIGELRDAVLNKRPSA